MKKLFNSLSVVGLALTASLGFMSAAQEASAQEPLVVYSNSLSDGRQEWLDSQATEAGFELEFIDAGGGEILNRLLAEAGAPQADVTFGMDESSFMTLVDNDLLVPYEPSWSAQIPEEANIGEGNYYPLVEQRIFMIHNPEFVSEADAPENWQDLAANEEFHGMYRVPDELGGGTNQKAVMSILLQYQDPEGELGISQEGWDQVEAYLANGYMTPESEDFNQNFADGTVPISYYSTSSIPGAEEEFGFTATPINPPQGVITMREQIGLINKGEDHDYTTAQEFVDWFGSTEVQSAWAQEFNSHPVNVDAYDSMTDRVTEIVEATTPMEVDWNFVRENLPSWIEKVELELWP